MDAGVGCNGFQAENGEPKTRLKLRIIGKQKKKTNVIGKFKWREAFGYGKRPSMI